MQFNGELIRFKSMKDALRIEIDIPKIDSTRVMQSITNFIDKPLTVDINVDSNEAGKSIVLITDQQKAKIHILYKELGAKFNYTELEAKSRLKGKFLGSKEQSITELSKMQASEFIDRLEALNQA